MKEDNVLDDWQEEQQGSGNHFQRAKRFLLYSVGILLVLAGRLSFILLTTSHLGVADLAEWQTPPLFLLGAAGTWLFSGLGLLSLYRTRSERSINLTFALFTVAHLGIFVFSCVYLMNGFYPFLL